MKQHDHAQETRATEAEQRQPWIKPVVQKMKAGDAELGTRSNSDGPFSSS